MWRLTSFCLWNCITLRWEELHFFPTITAFLNGQLQGPHEWDFRKGTSLGTWVHFRRCLGVSRMPRMEARWGSSLGMTFLYEHCGLFGKTWTLLVDISMTYHLKKDQGSNDNDQKSHFFCWEEMDRRFKGLSFARSGIHNETNLVIIHGRRGTDCIPIDFPTLKLR